MVYLIGKHLGGVSAFHYNSRLSKKHFILLFSSALVPTPILPAAATNRFFLKPFLDLLNYQISHCVMRLPLFTQYILQE